VSNGEVQSDELSNSDEERGVSSENSLPPPPNGRRRLTVVGLLAIAVSAWLVAFALYPAARFSIAERAPSDLGPLSSADLKTARNWVRGEARTAGKALSFERRGERGSFRLTQAQGRTDLWILLRVPNGIDEHSDGAGAYVPPSSFSGRLLPLSQPGLHYAPIAKMIEGAGHSTENSYLLLDGEVPASHRDSLWATLVLALLGTACLSLAVRLARRESSVL
jgi:hypothetical protein